MGTHCKRPQLLTETKIESAAVRRLAGLIAEMVCECQFACHGPVRPQHAAMPMRQRLRLPSGRALVDTAPMSNSQRVRGRPALFRCPRAARAVIIAIRPLTHTHSRVFGSVHSFQFRA